MAVLGGMEFSSARMAKVNNIVDLMKFLFWFVAFVSLPARADWPMLHGNSEHSGQGTGRTGAQSKTR